MPDDHKSKTFTYTSEGGVSVTLPALRSLNGGLLRKNRKLEGVDFVYTIIEAVADETTLALVDDLTSGEVNAMFEAWQEDGQASVGESSGSST